MTSDKHLLINLALDLSLGYYLLPLSTPFLLPPTSWIGLLVPWADQAHTRALGDLWTLAC